MFNWTVAPFIVGVMVGVGGTASLMHDAFTTLEKDFSDYKLEVTNANLQHANELLAKQEKIGEIDAKYTAELQKLQSENENLAGCIRSGKCGLRVQGTVQPAPKPAADGNNRPSVGTGATCELAGESRSAYIALRKGIAHQRAQLLEAQEILKTCQKRATK